MVVQRKILCAIADKGREGKKEEKKPEGGATLYP